MNKNLCFDTFDTLDTIVCKAASKLANYTSAFHIPVHFICVYVGWFVNDKLNAMRRRHSKTAYVNKVLVNQMLTLPENSSNKIFLLKIN